MKHLKKILPLLTILFNLGTLILLSVEIFIYPGIVQKYTHIGITVFLVAAIILTMISKISYPLFIKKIVYHIFPILMIFFAYLSYLEHTHFPNFIYSTYHLSLTSIQLLLIFLLVHYAICISSSKFFVKRISPLFSKQKFKYQTLILFIFSIIFSTLILKNNLNAKWSIIDDHEIAYYLGSDKKISLNEFPALISGSEAGGFGNTLRFRPVYSILRITESALWQNNPHLWYLTRQSILIFFFFSLSYIIASLLGIIPAIIFSLFVMTGSYWSDIWTRLGPSETYVVLGISLYSVGLFKISKEKSSSILSWLIFLLGGLIAIGSKENMVILALPSFYLLVNRIIGQKLNWKLIIPILHIIFAIFVSLSIYLAISKVGHDVYANEITTGGKLALLLPGIKKMVKDLKIIEIVIVAIVLLVFRVISMKKISIIEFISQKRIAFLLLIFFCITYLTQYIFYSGVWPTNMRYDLPGILAKQLFWITGLYIFSSLKTDKLSLNIIFFGFILISMINTGYYRLIKVSKNNASATSSFTENLSIISGTAKTHPDYPLVLKSEKLWDYEPVYSIERFIRFMGVTNPIYLNYSDKNIANRQGLEKQLSEELIQLSKNGNPGFGSFNPKTIGTRCISILISGVKDNNECVLNVKIN